MKIKIFVASLLITIVLVIISCKKEAIKNTQEYSSTPILPETPYEYEKTLSPFAPNPNPYLVAAGRVLFYDKSLSLNKTVACASCHQQSKAFCDNQQFSTGLQDLKTRRNTPSIFGKFGRMFWDGRSSDISDLVLRPVKNHVEMNFENLDALAKRISGIEYYKDIFKKAYGNSNIDSTKIKGALAEFIVNFNFSSNKFNKSQQNLEKLTATESIGKSIFFGKGKCSNCHHLDDGSSGNNNGYGFTNSSFNIGLDLEYTDNGVGEITGNTRDKGLFMVPVLLNVEYTAPYMHDGRFKTLEEVVEHYNSGIKNHPNLDDNLRALSQFENLSDQEILKLLDTNHNGNVDQEEINAIPPTTLGLTTTEKTGLVNFLKTLSDPSIFTDKKFSDPFKK